MGSEINNPWSLRMGERAGSYIFDFQAYGGGGWGQNSVFMKKFVSRLPILLVHFSFYSF